jgi:soluble cytochrome b562
MPSSTTSREERRRAFILLVKTLGEADVSLRSGEIDEIETAVGRVADAFDLYWERCQEDIGGPPIPTPTAEARVAILRTLSTLLAAMDRSLAKGDLKTVKAAIEQAREAVEVTASLDRTPGSSGIRQRFPQRRTK